MIDAVSLAPLAPSSALARGLALQAQNAPLAAAFERRYPMSTARATIDGTIIVLDRFGRAESRTPEWIGARLAP